MNLTLENINTIEKVVACYSDKYDFFGIRTQWEEFELGKIYHKSHVWIDNSETEEELDGICTIDVNKINYSSNYLGYHVAILASNLAEGGEDPGELILKDAIVIKILS